MGLSRAERQLGLTSDVAVFVAGPFGYGSDLRIDVGGLSLTGRLARRARFLGWAIRRYDIFHFNFGDTILTLRAGERVHSELSLLKLAGKTVLVTFQGCDVRPRSQCYCRRADCVEADRYRPANAARFLRHADRVFHLNPDLRRWLPGSHFIPYASVDPRRLTPRDPRQSRTDDEIVVAHAPSDRDVKGTRHVIEAVAAVRAKGVRIRLDLVEGVSNEAALARLSRADVVVDQLLLGWYGAAAVEAMALERPVLCFIREDEPADNPFGDALPIVRTTAATLVHNIIALARSSRLRRELGIAGRRFVEREHDPRSVARRALDGIAQFPGEESP